MNAKFPNKSFQEHSRKNDSDRVNTNIKD